MHASTLSLATSMPTTTRPFCAIIHSLPCSFGLEALATVRVEEDTGAVPRSATGSIAFGRNGLSSSNGRFRSAARSHILPNFLDTRAQGMPGARCTRSLACKIKKHTSVVTTGLPKSSGIPRAMVYDLYRALPGDRALLSPSPVEITSANLTPASRRQNHTTSSSASRAVRQQRIGVHRISPRVRDDREPPLLVGRDGAVL
jgi:hypothetical protein